MKILDFEFSVIQPRQLCAGNGILKLGGLNIEFPINIHYTIYDTNYDMLENLKERHQLKYLLSAHLLTDEKMTMKVYPSLGYWIIQIIQEDNDKTIRMEYLVKLWRVYVGAHI